MNLIAIKKKKKLKDNDIGMHSIYNEEKSVVVERFIRTFKIRVRNI